MWIWAYSVMFLTSFPSILHLICTELYVELGSSSCVSYYLPFNFTLDLHRILSGLGSSSLVSYPLPLQPLFAQPVRIRVATVRVMDRAYAQGSTLLGPQTTVQSIVVTAVLVVVVGALPWGQVKLQFSRFTITLLSRQRNCTMVFSHTSQ